MCLAVGTRLVKGKVANHFQIKVDKMTTCVKEADNVERSPLQDIVTSSVDTIEETRLRRLGDSKTRRLEAHYRRGRSDQCRHAMRT